jgi:hypothetical protein
LRAFGPQHAALLEALRGERVVPSLLRRVSLERCAASDQEVVRLTDWPTALRESPEAWAELEPALEDPEAWPDAWERARALGFTPRADHHHALLFARLTDTLIARQEHETARYTWRECLRSWCALLSTDYARELVGELVEPGRVDEVGAEVVSALLAPLPEARAGALSMTLRLDDEHIPPGEAPDRRLARLHWQALEAVGEVAGDADGAWGALASLRRAAAEAKQRVVEGAVARFEGALEALDLTQVDSDTLRAPFEWLAELFALLGHHEASSITAVRSVVETGWKLRKVGRDEEGDFERLLELMQPFNEDLCARHLAGTSFGHNSKCADYLTFQAEFTSDAPPKRALLEGALAVCPGHRNASMLMSYAHLNRANVLMNMTKLYPGVAGALPGGGRIESLVREAWAELEAATRTWPHNESVDGYRATVIKEAERFGVDLGGHDEAGGDAGDDAQEDT